MQFIVGVVYGVGMLIVCNYGWFIDVLVVCQGVLYVVWFVGIGLVVCWGSWFFGCWLLVEFIGYVYELIVLVLFEYVDELYELVVNVMFFVCFVFVGGVICVDWVFCCGGLVEMLYWFGVWYDLVILVCDVFVGDDLFEYFGQVLLGCCMFCLLLFIDSVDCSGLFLCVVIGWNGSIEVIWVMYVVLLFLYVVEYVILIDGVRMCLVDDMDELVLDFDFMCYFVCYGIVVQCKMLCIMLFYVGEVLFVVIVYDCLDLLVMGGYSYLLVCECIFGGVMCYVLVYVLLVVLM